MDESGEHFVVVAKSAGKKIDAALIQFAKDLDPLEEREALLTLADNRTGAWYCECHLRAKKLIGLGTVDVPLDPDDQAEYRANRDIVEDAQAFEAMKEDAKRNRSFSNIVTEYTRDFDADHPLKVIGGQHRFEAIRLALQNGVDEVHGVKVYLGLDMEQFNKDVLDKKSVQRIAKELRDGQMAGVKGTPAIFVKRYIRLFTSS